MGYGVMSRMKPCKRFRADGSAGANRTDYNDGWCRLDDCPGFLRPDPAQAPSRRFPPGTAKHILQTGNLSVGDVTVEDVTTIRITKRTTDSFRRHHGGGERDAEVQLRSMRPLAPATTNTSVIHPSSYALGAPRLGSLRQSNAQSTRREMAPPAR